MKRLALTLVILAGFALGGMAQNIWKPINGTGILGASPDGSIFAYGEYGTLSRSQDDGETWQTVLGQETGFIGHINSSCFAVSPEGRICVFNDNQQTVVYSDDNGDTWQQTPSISSCAMPDKAGLCVPTNDIMVVWAENGEISYTLDGGETWEGWILDFLENSESVSDLLVNENGDVYVSVDYYIMNIVGIYHSTLSGIQNWELVAFEGISIKDMAFDPEGNVVACGYNADGSSVGFQHIPGFYLFDGTSLAISDEGVVYTPHFMGLQAVLSYSTDHGEHFTELGEHLPLVDIAPGGENPRLFKGYDNHLYFDGGGEYWKSVRDADHIDNYHPVVEDGKQWNVLFSYPWTPPEPQHKYTDIYKIEGDTLLDGVPYKMMYATRNENLTGWNLWGFIRETEDGQVFSRRPSTSDEQLLYDFSMEVGDTICMCDYGYDECCMVVIEKGEIIVNGEPRQQIVLEYPFGNGVEEVWIEGIGSLFGIVDSGSLFLTGGSTNLLCYYEDGDLIWQNTTPGYDECYMVYPTPPTPPEPHHFAPLGAEWYFHVWSQGPITEPPFSYIRKTVSGVEEVQGHTCSVIDLYDYVYEEDNIVYWYNQDNDAFTVLYDFNAEAGESWYCDITGCSFLVTVQSVDSVTWNNRTYRTQYVAGCYADNLDNVVFQGRIIDGIGYEKGLFFNWGSCGIICGADYEYMRCYLEDGELLYHEGDYDCDYVPGNQPQQPQFEWYYEIQNEDGSITYQYMYQAGDTIVQDEPTHILVKINTLYDKGLRDEVTHEYVYERDGKLYWWNKTLEEFTVLYDYEAEVGDSWEIKVGTRTLDMHVDAVEEIEYEGRTYRMLRVSDPEDLFSGNIVCGIGHLTSFFPERLMDKGDGVRVEGMRCYWVEDELVFKYGDEDCDAIYDELHGVEEDGPSTGSETFAVYPNPTNGVLFVETVCTPSLPVETYRIANLMGQTVLTGQITAETQQINVSSLPQGMYFITFAGETRKFVVR
ncbi:MAG: T9SS type A sorting domain-containing protein [Bacteroidales bacterium]|nr:T9SS type A sorting domain-containing protein [Bacteroidales bacterium]MBR6931186.1 T9SS type A sorting domain-containing protein [Bacteroidales bacterium]